MTVSRHRRRISTTRAVVAALAVAAAAVGIGAGGYRVVVNTTDGQVVGSDAPEVAFPETPTGVLAITDDAGSLASVAVLVVRPGDGDEPGIGGTVVPLPVSADSSGGFGDERLPLDETVALFGPGSLVEEVSLLLGVEIDEGAVLDAAGLAAYLEPLGSITVDLPAAVTDGDGRQVADAGPQTLTTDEVASVLSAIDPEVSGPDRYTVGLAVWRGVADAVGAGAQPPLAVHAMGAEASDGPPVPPSDGFVLAAVSAGPIAVQPLRSSPIASVDLNPRGVDAAALDRAEVLLVFGHVAPGKVAAPNAGYNFRVVSRFSDDQLADGVSRLDVAYTAIGALLDVDANVISVDTAAEEADDITTVAVDAEPLVDAAGALGDVFGTVEVEVANTRIAGIDVTITLGADYLSRLDAGAADASTAAPQPSAPLDVATSTGSAEDAG